MEEFKASERHVCEELYRAEEYNRVREHVAGIETFRSEEVNIQTESVSPWEERRKKRRSQTGKKLLMTGSSFSAVGAVAGAVIIVAATIAAASVPNVAAARTDITSYSIGVQFEIENDEDVPLVATLEGGEERFMYPLGEEDSVYFAFLEPSTEYTLAVADGSDKVYFTQTYVTADYSQAITPVEYGGNGYAYFMQFSAEDLTEEGYEVRFDGELLADRLTADFPWFSVEGLEPNTMHTLRISDPANGRWLYNESVSSGNVLYASPVYINADSAMFDFSFNEFNGNPLEVYLDGELQDVTFGEGKPYLTIDLTDREQDTYYAGLKFGQRRTVDIVDTQTGELLYRNELTVPDVAVQPDTGMETALMQDSVTQYIRLAGAERRNVTVSLLLNGDIVESRTMQTSGAGEEGAFEAIEFENLSPDTRYTFRITDGRSEVALYEAYTPTSGYLVMPDARSEYFNAQNIKVYVMPQNVQADLYCFMPEGYLFEEAMLNITPVRTTDPDGMLSWEFNPDSMYGDGFILNSYDSAVGDIYEAELVMQDGTVLDRIQIEIGESTARR